MSIGVGEVIVSVEQPTVLQPTADTDAEELDTVAHSISTVAYCIITTIAQAYYSCTSCSIQ